MRCSSTKTISSSAEIAAGSADGASSTMSMPAAPPPAWTAVEPWWCGWYQKVPPMWSGGMTYVYVCVSPGLISTKMSSPGLSPEMWSPCVCMFVVSKSRYSLCKEEVSWPISVAISDTERSLASAKIHINELEPRVPIAPS